METQIRVADRTGQLQGPDLNPLQERAVEMMIEIELRQKEEAEVLQARTHRLLSTMAGMDFDVAYAGTGTSLPAREAPLPPPVSSDAEIDQVVTGNGATVFQGVEDDSFDEADWQALMGELQTARFSAAQVTDVLDESVWGDPV